MNHFLLSLILLLAPVCSQAQMLQAIVASGSGGGGGITPISLLGGGNGFVSCAAGGAGGCTTSAINTTGASLLVAVDCYYNINEDNFSDSKSNTWSELTEYSISGTGSASRCIIKYAINPTVGSGHTFQDIGTFGSVSIYAFAGANTSSPYVASSDTGTSATSCSSGSPCPPGSKSIAEGNVEVTFFLIGNDSWTGTLPSDTDYTIDGTTGPAVSATVAHLVAGTTASRNPAWVPSSGTQTVAVGAAIFAHQ